MNDDAVNVGCVVCGYPALLLKSWPDGSGYLLCTDCGKRIGLTDEEVGHIVLALLDRSEQ